MSMEDGKDEGQVPMNPPMDRPGEWRPGPGIRLLLDGLGAVAWGVFFIASPIAEVLFMGAVVWVPLLIWREWRRSRRPRFWPGLFLRVGIVTGLIMLAKVAPTKCEDQMRVGPLSAATLPLGRLAEEVDKDRVSIKVGEGKVREIMIRLPSTTPSVRQLIDAVEATARFKYVPRKCGNSMTVLWGAYPIWGIEIYPTEDPHVAESVK